MKRKPSKNALAFKALMAAEDENRKLTLEEAVVIQDSSEYSRFSIGGDILTPIEVQGSFDELVSKLGERINIE